MNDYELKTKKEKEDYETKKDDLEKVLSTLSAMERSEFDQRLWITISACQERNSLVKQHHHLLELEKKQAKKWDKSYLIFVVACFVLVPALYFYDPTLFEKAVFGLIVGANFIYWGLIRKIESSTNWVVERNLRAEISRLERETNQFGVLTRLSEACRSVFTEGSSDDSLKEWLVFSRDKALLDLKYEILKTMHIAH